jgi:hypothetical protein
VKSAETAVAAHRSFLDDPKPPNFPQEIRPPLALGNNQCGRTPHFDKRCNFLVRRLDFFVKRLCNAVMKTKRVAIYVRVSTNEQDTGGQETELYKGLLLTTVLNN